MATMLVTGVSGCTTVRWSFQAVEGHFDLLARREPIAELIADPETSPVLRDKLMLALRLRDYASAELGLPDNDSYRSYADLQRSAVVWNVVATPQYSLHPQTWCYPLAGCLAYRGWYRRHAAEADARRLHRKQRDVLVSPATAYSTLGWFDDPVLNTMLAYSEAYLEPVLARLIFHELAHQQLFVAGASAFNEAFAETVAIAGVQRWLQLQDDVGLAERWEAWQAANVQINNLLAAARQQLQSLYASQPDEETALRGKQQVFLDLRRAYLGKLGATPSGSAMYRALLAWQEWFAQPLNNAHLALHATYQEGVQAFQQLLACNGADLTKFYQAADIIGEWSEDQRDAWLAGSYPTPPDVCAGG